MSAIFGKFNTDAQLSAESDLGLMEQTLDHWQADKKGVWLTDGGGMGNLLLYNTPESLNEQLPLWHPAPQLSIVADARIDNREELYQLLHLQGEERTFSDSKLILLLYEKYGRDCIKYLIGDLAFAIWDARNQTLFCARDHMGAKPFFYYNDAHFFAFASEKKGILCLPKANKTIDKQFFYNQVLYPVVQAADTTLYQHIHRLPPAHTLVYYRTKNKLELNSYWTLDATKEIVLQRDEEYYDGLRHHFEQAVACRLRSAYPIGCELSGGLDSSAITGVASYFLKKAGGNVVAFSNVDSSESLKNAHPARIIEQGFAEEVIRFNDIERFVLVNKDHWRNPLDEVDFSLKVHDGLDMRTMVWQAGIKRAAQDNGVRALLSGFPGDEMVTYMGQFYFMDHLDEGNYLKYLMAPKTKDWTFSKFKPFTPAAIEFLFHKMKNIATAYDRKMRNIPDVLQPPLKYRLNKRDVVWRDSTFLERYKSHRHFQRYRLLKPDIALRMEAETRLGMYFRLEPRFPMADIRLCQYYLSMPNRLKSGGEMNRWTYRQAVGRYLPEMVLHRTDKSGSTAPFKIDPALTLAWRHTLADLLAAAHNKAGKKTNGTNKEYTNFEEHYVTLLRWWVENFEYLNK